MSVKNLLVIDMLLKHADLTKGLNEVQTQVGNFSKSLTDLSEASGNKFDAFGTKMQAQGAQISALGGALTTSLTLPLMALGGVALKSSIEFESAFAGVKKTVDASTEELAKMSEEIKHMATVIPATTTEISGVAEIAGQLGIQVPNIMKFTEVMINMGVATNLGAEEAATNLARLANIMKSAPDDYERMGSAIVGLGNNYATSEKEIVALTMRMASAGKQMNMSEADIFGLAAGFSSMGLTAEAGGTAISKWMTTMANASRVGSKGMDELSEKTGKTARELEMMAATNSKEFKALAESIGRTPNEMNQVIKAGRDLEKMADLMGMSTKELSKTIEEDAVGALTGFFDAMVRANQEGKSGNEILTEFNINEVRLKDAMLRGATAADILGEAVSDSNKFWRDNVALTNEASQRYETLESKIQMMKNAFNNVLIALGDQLKPMMGDLTDFMTKLATSISEMDPKTFEMIVGSLVKVATIGPALMITGKAMSTIGTTTKLVNGAFQGLNKTMSGGTLKSFSEGGWTRGWMEFFGASKNVENGVFRTSKTMEKFGISAKGAFSSDLKTAITGVNAEMAKTGNVMHMPIGNIDKLKVGIRDMSLTGKEFAGSPFGKGLTFMAIASYAIYAYQSSEPFRNLIDKIVKLVKDLAGAIGNALKPAIDMIQAPFKAFGTNILDVTVLIGAFALALATVNPIMMGILAALAALKIGAEVWDHFANPKKPMELADALDIVAGKFDEISTPMDEVASEHIPKLQEQFEALNQAMMFLSLGDAGQAEAGMFGGVEEYVRMLTVALDAQQNAMLEANANYMANSIVGEEQKQANAEKDLALIKSFKTKALEATNEHVEAIRVLEEQSKGDIKNLNEEQRKEYMFHLAEMNRIAMTTLSADEARLYGEMVRLQKKKADGLIEEKSKEAERLAALEKEWRDTEIAKVDEGIGATLFMYRQGAELGYIEKEEALAREGELLAESLEHEENVYRKSLDALGVIIDGGYLNRVQEYENHTKEMQKIRKIESENMMDDGEGNTIVIDQELQKQIELEKEALQDKIDLKKKDRDSFDIVMNKIKEMPPEVRRVYEDVNGEVTMESALDYLAGTVPEFKRIGIDTVEGQIAGMESKKKSLWAKARELGDGVSSWVKKVLNIQSPSRVMREIGQYTAEGMELGIEDGTEDVFNASKEMADGITDIMDIDTNFSGNVSRQINDVYSESGNAQFASAIAKAMAVEMSKAPIKAVIGEDDMREGVNDVIRREQQLEF